MLKNKSMFFDLDGTLLGVSRKLHPETEEELRKARENGNKIYLCSGRPPKYLQTGICREFPFDGMVACAGGCVLCGDDFIFENAIPLSVIEDVLSFFRTCGIAWQFDTKDGTYSTPEMDRLFSEAISRAVGTESEQAEGFRKEQEHLYDLGVNHRMADWTPDLKVQKIIFTTPDLASYDALCRQMSDRFVINIFFKDEHNAAGELFPLNCTKEQGIARILEHTGASWEDTIGFGDSRNDLEMLQAVRIKVAAVYAPDEVRAAADLFFENPDQGGIGKVLRRLNSEMS